MSVWSILLRLLLTVGLILNGSSYAVASAHMQMDHMTMSASASQPAEKPVVNAEPPCAGHHHSRSETGDTSFAYAATDLAAFQSGLPSPDCCDSGSCRCSCVHPSPTAVTTAVFQPAVFEQSGCVGPTLSAHAPPVSPRLIRPPIV